MTDAEYLSHLLTSAMTPTSNPTPETNMSDALLASLNQQPQFNVQDGDTINNWRVNGIDTPESYIESAKAQKLADSYGVPLEVQQRLGQQAKERTSQLLQDPNYGQFTPGGDLIDSHGRILMDNQPLTDKLLSEGYAAPMDRYNEKAQSLYRSAQEKKRNLGYTEDADYMEAIRQSNIEYQDPGFLGSVGKMADAFQSKGIQILGKSGDLITDAIGWGAEKLGADRVANYLDKLGETWSDTSYADKMTGYDRREATFKQQEALAAFKQGDYTGAFLNALTVAPEMVAESLPMMFEMVFGIGGKAKATGKALKGMNNLLKRNAGFAMTVGQETNNQAEEFEAQNGRKVTGSELAEMSAVNLFTLGLDRLAFKEIVGMKHELSSVAEHLPKVTREGIMGKVLGTTAKLSTATAIEGTQEYIQTWGEILNVNVDKSWSENFANTKLQDEAIIGGIMGAAGGTVMSGTVSPVLEMVDNKRAKDKANAPLNEQELTDTLRKFQEATAQDTPESKELSKDFLTTIQNTETTLEEKAVQIDEVLNKHFPDSSPKKKEAIRDYYIHALSKLDTATTEESIPDTPLESEIPTDTVNPMEEVIKPAEELASTQETDIPVEAEPVNTKPVLTELEDKSGVIYKNANNEEFTFKGTGNSYTLYKGTEYIGTTNKGKKEAIKIANAYKPDPDTNSDTQEDVPSGLKFQADKFKSNKDMPVTIVANQDRIVSSQGVKDKRHETLDDNFLKVLATEGISTEELQTIMSNKQDSKILQRSGKHFASGGKGVETTREIVAKITEHKDSVKELLKDTIDISDTNEAAETQALRLVTLALDRIMGGEESTKNEAKNSEVELEEGLASIGTFRTQIGKDFYNSYGGKLKGKDKDIIKEYDKLGDVAIQLAKELGYIEILKGKKIPVPENTVLQDGETLSNKTKKGQIPENINFDPDSNTMFTTAVKLNTDIFKDLKNKKSEFAKNINRLATLLRPGNYEMPMLAGEGQVIIDNNRSLNANQYKTLKNLSKLTFEIKPEFIELLRGIKEYIDNALKENPKLTFDTLVEKDAFLQKFLGKKPDIIEEYEASIQGYNRNRADTLRNLLDVLEDIVDAENGLGNKFSFAYSVAVNQRIHVLNTLLDFQGDKFLARQIVTGGKYTTNNEKEAIVLINSLADEMDVTGTDIINGTLSKKTEEHLAILEKEGSISRKVTNLILTGLEKQPFEYLSQLQAILDIRKAYKENKPNNITTNYMPGFDAVSSGVVITLLNLSGDKFVQGLVKKLDVEIDGVSNNDVAVDPYELVTNFIEDPSSFADIMPAVAYDTLDYSQLIKEMDELIEGKVFKNRRALAKYPVIKATYGQAEENTKTDIAKEITLELITAAIVSKNQYAIKKIRSILGEETSRKDLDRKAIKKLETYFEENIAKGLVEAYGKVYSPIKNYRNKVSTIFNQLIKTGKWDGTIRAPYQALDGDTNPKHNMSVKKVKNEFIEADGQMIWSTTPKEHFNETSMAVNPQHGSDSGTLTLSLEELLNKMLEQKDTRGIMTIHDNTMGTPEQLLQIKPAYEETTKRIAIEYDFIEEMLNQLKKAVKLLQEENSKINKEDTSLIKESLKVISKIEKENTELKQSKQVFLRDIKTDLFGLNKSSLESLTTSEPETETKVETVTETKLEPQVVKEVQPKKETKAKPQGPAHILKQIHSLAKDITQYKDDAFITESLKPKMLELLNLLKEKATNKEYKALADKLIALYKDGKYEILVSDKGNQFYARQGKIFVPDTKGKLPKDERTGDKHSINTIISSMAHEVDHAIHNAYIQENFATDSGLKYLYKNVISKIGDTIKTMPMNTLRNRMYYLTPEAHIDYLTKENPTWSKEQIQKQANIQAVKELISVVRNEPDFAEGIMNTLYPEDKGRYKQIKAKMLEIWNNLVAWFNSNPTISDNLPVNMGRTLRVIELVQFKASVSPANPDLGIVSYLTLEGASRQSMTKYEETVDAVNSFARDFLRSIYDIAADAAGPTIKAFHDKAMKDYPVYAGIINLIYTGFYKSDLANQLRSSLGLKNNYNKKKFNDLAQLAYSIIKESKTYLTNNLPDLDDMIKAKYTKEEIPVLNTIFSRGGLGYLLGTTLYDDLITGKIILADAIKDAKKGLTAKELMHANNMVKYNLEGQVSSNMANLDSFGDLDKLNILVSLESLNKIPDSIKILSDMKTKNRTIYDKLVELTVAIKHQKEIINLNLRHSPLGDVATSTFVYHDFDGHGTHDIYNEKYEFVVVTEKDMKTDKFSKNNQWITVRTPTATTFGIVARKSFDSGFVEGLGLNFNRFSNGVSTNEDITKQLNGDSTSAVANNAIKTDGGNYRIILTAEEKAKLEYVENPAQTLMRTFVANKEVIEADSVRDLVLGEFVENMTYIDLKALADNISTKKADNVYLPMFIKIDAYTTFESLEQEIQDNYTTPIGLSTFGGFNEKVTLVRKDFNHILLGHQNVQISGDSNSVVLKRSDELFRRGIAWFKMKLAVASPLKLAVDAISNMTYLMTVGVGITDIFKYGEEAYTNYNSLSKYRGLLINTKLKYALTKDSKYEKHIKNLEDAIKKNKFYTGEQYGFVQSYSTDLITKDFDVISGLQSDIDKIINSIIKTDKDELNGIGKAIEWWSDFGASKGFTVNDLLENAVRLSKTNKTTIGKEILNIAGRLKKHKDNKQLDRYVGEILASPASEIIKVGSAVMVSTDAISKYIYANFLLSKVNNETGKLHTEEEAYLKANDSFIDYRINMPKEVKALSDYGVLMFPGYWMRIQKVIFRMFAEHPVNAVIAATSSHITGLSGTNIIDSNIFDKILEGRVFNATSPLDAFLP